MGVGRASSASAATICSNEPRRSAMPASTAALPTSKPPPPKSARTFSRSTPRLRATASMKTSAVSSTSFWICARPF
jgi:hypothetical protein